MKVVSIRVTVMMDVSARDGSLRQYLSSIKVLQPLRGRNFRLLWIGSLISYVGAQLTLIAFPWLVLQLTADPMAMGTVLALSSIPRVVFMVFGGAFTDRFSARTVMLWSTPTVNWALFVTALCGIVDGYLIVLLISWLQARVQKELLGRVMSMIMVFTSGLAPVSAAVAGWLISISLEGVFLGAGSILVGLSLFGLCVPVIRRFGMSPL